jgi:hypothetical protein
MVIGPASTQHTAPVVARDSTIRTSGSDLATTQPVVARDSTIRTAVTWRRPS